MFVWSSGTDRKAKPFNSRVQSLKRVFFFFWVYVICWFVFFYLFHLPSPNTEHCNFSHFIRSGIFEWPINSPWTHELCAGRVVNVGRTSITLAWNKGRRLRRYTGRFFWKFEIYRHQYAINPLIKLSRSVLFFISLERGLLCTEKSRDMPYNML